MNSSDTSHELDDRSGAIGPGSQLQAARIDRGLSVEDVANRMHLSTRIIESIEENDFDVITAPIFVKGYLRAYARIVLLNEDEMIAQYTEAYSNSDPIITSTSTIATVITVDDARIKWTTYLVILVLMVLIGIWWWNKNQNRADVLSLDALQSDSLSQSNISENFGADNTMADDLLVGEIESISETAADVTNEVFAGQSVDDSSMGTVIVEELALLPEDEPAPYDFQTEVVAGEDIPQQQIGEVLEDAGLITLSAPMGTDQLFMIVHADTWADIKDSGGHQLVYDLLREGQKYKFIGKAPFAVFLGNGHGVELTYDQESVDFTDNIRDDNTARLKIGS